MTDNTAQLQQLIDSANGQPVTIGPGTYYIDIDVGLQLRNNLILNIQGTLHANPSANTWSKVLMGSGVQNVQVNFAQGSEIVGDKTTHLNQNGQWGMGILLENCTNVSLSGPGVVYNCWGDGLYLIGCKDIKVTDVIFESNRRNDCSVIAIDGLTIQGCAFNSAAGTAPEAGIDLEPDTPDEFIKNVSISGCQFVDNNGCGILFGFGGAPQSNFSGISINGNTFKGNKPISGIVPWYANLLYACCRWIPGYSWWGFYTSITL